MKMFVNKEISVFPKPYNYTPYNKFNFKTAIHGNCASFVCSLKVCKIIILGDVCVGKTSVLNRFCYKIFDNTYRSTIGVDFQCEEINILGIPYHLQIWDTAGQERFKCITQCYYRKAHAVMVIFDLSAIRTLANCKKWLQDALEVSNSADDPPYIFLVGSKKDLLSEASYKITEDMALNTAKNLQAEYWSVSSKTGENIDELFCRVAALCFDDDQCKATMANVNNRSIQIGQGISLQNRDGKKRHNKCDNFKCVTGVLK